MSQSLARKRPRATSGPLFLFLQMQTIKDNGLYELSVDETDMTKWTIGLPATTLKHFGMVALARDVMKWAKLTGKEASVVMAVSFPKTFPQGVPFVRVVRPRFAFHTGHVTVGGSFCTELLTPAGWRTMDVSSLLDSLCLTMKEGDAKIRLTPDMHCFNPFVDYAEAEARLAYDRVARFHGWIN
mgnify:CR=1 FL=1